MDIDQAEIERMAARLWEAEQSGSPIAPIRTENPAITEADAYQIQAINVSRHVANGNAVAGRKIGLTSQVVQKQLGVDQPDFGSVFANRLYCDNAELSPDMFIAPKAEAEISLILGRNIDVPNPTIADVMRSIEYVVASIEIVDSRVADWDIRFVDTVADNASFGATVISGTARKLEGLDLRGCGMSLDINGRQACTGVGAACLGHPLNAATWLAQKLASVDTPLREGDVIMTGALGPMAPFVAGDTIEAQIEGLGSVRANIGVS